VIRFEVGGKSWDWDERVMLQQAIRIEAHTGGTIFEWEAGLLDGKSSCYQALGWLVVHGGDPDVPIGSVDFPVMELAGPYLKARMVKIDELTAAVRAARDAGETPADRQEPEVPASEPAAGAKDGS
jgi:hypothetical protein